MKLGLICRPYSFHGGVETATAGLLSELLKRGYAVDLLSTARQPDVPGAQVRRLPTVAGPSVLRFVSFALAARHAVRRGAYDIVQSHERTLEQDLYRAGEGTHRGYLRAMGRRPGPTQVFHRLICAMEARIFRLETARHIVAISERDKTEIERLYETPPERVSVVYNGVDLERFHPDNRARFGPAMRTGLGLRKDDWVVVFVGSGFERKGLGTLIEALAGWRDGSWRCAVAGKGDPAPYQRQATALGIGDRVRWLGPRRDVDRLYAMADVVALPALYEPFGNVHLEALAAGVPVLASARSGGAEVVHHRETGWVAEPTVPQVAEGLGALRDLRAPDVAALARKSAEPFTCAAQAEGFTRIYRSLTGHRG